MRDLRELNINHGGRPVARKPPTEEDVAAFQVQYGIELPADLLEVLRCSNGGHPERDTVSLAGAGRNDRVSVNRFYHLDASDRGSESMWFAVAHWSSILGTQALPFASDGGGNQFFIDLADGAVKWCHHDAEMEVFVLAESFEAFVDALEVDEDMV